RMRFFSNALAVVTVVPVIVSCVAGCSELVKDARPRRYAEAALLVIGLLAVGTSVFFGLEAGPGATPALLYAPLPFLLWAAVRFGTGEPARRSCWSCFLRYGAPFKDVDRS